MAWFQITAYTPVLASGTGTLGAIGGGWTDTGNSWRLANLGGGASDAALQATYNSSNPWSTSELLRLATSEAAQNVRLRMRFQSNGTDSPALSDAPWFSVRWTGSSQSTANALLVRTSSFYVLANGVLSGTQGSGTVTGAGYASGNWYDIEATVVTSGSTTTLTERTWTVANHMTDAFASGSLITPTAGNSWTTPSYPNVIGATGIFFYHPGTTTGGGNISFFSSETDVAATTLSLSPSTATGQAGSPITFTLGVNGAQNGGAVTLSDAGAGGTFSPATVTLAAGVSATQTITYTPARAGSITVTASSAALTGTALTATATATATVTAGPATALALSPRSQSAIAGAATGTFTVSANGSLASATALSLSDGGAGGVFSPSSLSLASGVGTTGTFTYTPAAAATGTVTLSASASGLTTATATVSVTATGTALAVSPSSQTVSAGVASGNFTVALASGGLAAATTVTLSDAASGGTFTPPSLTLAAGASPTATFTYTPAAGATGSKSLTATAPGLSSATSTVVVSLATILTPTNASVVASPYNWVTGLANSTTSDSSAMRAWNAGAYLRVYLSGTTSVNIIFGASTTAASFIYQVDDGLPSSPTTCLNNGSYIVTLPDTGAHSVTFTLYSISQVAGRWSGALAVTINGFQLGTGGTAAAATRGTRNLLIYGDSITEGTQSRDGSDGVTTGYAYLVGESHRRQGWEYGIKGAGFSGYSVAVPSANGGQPAAWTSGDDTNSSWNKIDGSGVSGSAITTGASGGGGERYLVQPALIIDAWGTNDGLQSIADPTVQASVTGFLQRVRVAAPSAIIVTVIPFGGYKRTAIQAAAVAAADPKLLVVDPKTDARMTATGYCGNLLSGASSGQSVHPWSLGSAHLAALVLRQIDAGYVPFATARSFGSAS